jgi:uncharacterized protein YdiU (UPF0061 family)
MLAAPDTGLAITPHSGLEALRFDNRYVRELPGDPAADAGRRQVHGALWSAVAPSRVAAPRLIAASPEVAALIDLDPAALASAGFAEVFAGNRLLPGMVPNATNYGGHQFGSWAGQLGDGRAINLGEVVNGRGEHWTLQLKGAGPTPYSRTADGRAVLRSSLREFVCSEAMHHLGVPTTRALSLVATGEQVLRDMFYDGRPRYEPGAIVCRVARSFTRIGHFELPAARGDEALLRALADYTIRHDFPELGPPSRDTYVRWFDEVCRRTRSLIVHWMRVGFVHGVMNTDNLSVLGETIDYGPYGWLEDYDPRWTPNTTDAVGRRYAYGRQPEIALWNLVRFANAIQPLVGETAPLEAALRGFADGYEPAWLEMTASRLGLERFDATEDAPLVAALYDLLGAVETDYLIFHRRLARVDPAAPSIEPLHEAFYLGDALPKEHLARTEAWVREWAARVAAAENSSSPEAAASAAAARRARMDALNPLYVPRNWLAQEAIDAAEREDLEPLHALIDTLRRPYSEQPGREHYAAKRPDWARARPGCSMLSCSS